MNFEYYKFIMNKQFELMKGMYFDECQENEGYAFFKSNIINDNFWNFATCMTYQDFQKDRFLENVESTLKQQDRVPCIYIPTFMENSDLIREYLSSNSYQIKDHEAFMFFSNKSLDINVKNRVSEVKSKEELKAFLDVLNDAFGGEPTEENPYGGSVDASYEKALEKSLDNSQGRFHHMVLFEDNRPVSIATLTYKEGYGGLYNVGTKFKYQNKGYGKQIIKVCIDKFNELGGGKLYLFTEKDSKNELWYKKLGFETTFINEQYVLTTS
jgi:ribosomal protein S18 acetylase RimI-like enzyme